MLTGIAAWVLLALLLGFVSTRNITRPINQVNEIVATIATSVDSQLATTHEVAGNVREAALGFGEINENVVQCSQVRAGLLC